MKQEKLTFILSTPIFKTMKLITRSFWSAGTNKYPRWIQGWSLGVLTLRVLPGVLITRYLCFPGVLNLRSLCSPLGLSRSDGKCQMGRIPYVACQWRLSTERPWTVWFETSVSVDIHLGSTFWTFLKRCCEAGFGVVGKMFGEEHRDFLSNHCSSWTRPDTLSSPTQPATLMDLMNSWTRCDSFTFQRTKEGTRKENNGIRHQGNTFAECASHARQVTVTTAAPLGGPVVPRTVEMPLCLHFSLCTQLSPPPGCPVTTASHPLDLK